MGAMKSRSESSRCPGRKPRAVHYWREVSYRRGRKTVRYWRQAKIPAGLEIRRVTGYITELGRVVAGYARLVKAATKPSKPKPKPKPKRADWLERIQDALDTACARLDRPCKTRAVKNADGSVSGELRVKVTNADIYDVIDELELFGVWSDLGRDVWLHGGITAHRSRFSKSPTFSSAGEKEAFVWPHRASGVVYVFMSFREVARHLLFTPNVYLDYFVFRITFSKRQPPR